MVEITFRGAGCEYAGRSRYTRGHSCCDGCNNARWAIEAISTYHFRATHRTCDGCKFAKLDKKRWSRRHDWMCGLATPYAENGRATWPAVDWHDSCGAWERRT